MGGGVLQVIYEMFKTKEAKRKGKDVKYKCLGLYGKSGVGKTTICRDAMCNFYQVNYRGGFCRVRLDNEGKAAERKASDGLAASNRRLARLMDVIKQLVGVRKSMSTIMTEKEVINSKPKSVQDWNHISAEFPDQWVCSSLSKLLTISHS